MIPLVSLVMSLQSCTWIYITTLATIFGELYSRLLRELSESNERKMSFGRLRDRLEVISKSVDRVNGLLSNAVLFSLSFNASLSSISVSVISDSLNQSTIDLQKILSFASLVVIFELGSYQTCKASQDINDSMKQLCEGVDIRLAKRIPTTDVQKETIDTIFRLSKKMTLKANVFDISLKTYLTMAYIMTTYAIIFMQTN